MAYHSWNGIERRRLPKWNGRERRKKKPPDWKRVIARVIALLTQLMMEG